MSVNLSLINNDFLMEIPCIKKMDIFSEFPKGISELVFSFLNYREISAASSVCKKFHTLAYSPKTFNSFNNYKGIFNLEDKNTKIKICSCKDFNEKAKECINAVVKDEKFRFLIIFEKNKNEMIDLNLFYGKERNFNHSITNTTLIFVHDPLHAKAKNLIENFLLKKSKPKKDSLCFLSLKSSIGIINGLFAEDVKSIVNRKLEAMDSSEKERGKAVFIGIIVSIIFLSTISIAVSTSFL